MTAFTWCECRWPWRYFKVIRLFHIKFLVNCALYGKSCYRVLIGNHTLAFDWCHVWRSWSTFEGYFSLGCHFHVHFSNPWQAFASRCLPAIVELLVVLVVGGNAFSIIASIISFLATYRRTNGSRRSAWSKGRQPSGAVLRSSRELGELSQWPCHYDSSINIVLAIIAIIVIKPPQIQARPWYCHVINCRIEALQQYYWSPEFALLGDHYC